jgi:PAS domain S-box-containing protein
VLTTFRASRAYPVAIVTDIDRDHALRSWAIQTRALLIVVGTVLVAVVVLSFAYYRRQRQAIRERIEAERLQRINATVFDSSSEAIVIADTQAFVISVNAAFRSVAGYADEELVGRRLPDLFDEAGQASFAEMVERVDAQALPDASLHRMTAEARLKCKDGRWIWTEILSTPQFDARGEVTGFNRICRDISERRQMEEQVRQLAFFDPLTQLANRRLFLDRLKTAMAACRRNGTFGALMFLDLDNFKPLNDTCGHDVGDLLLIETANRLRACVRDSDSVGRFGGDEFVVILSALAHERDCIAPAGGCRCRENPRSPGVAVCSRHRGRERLRVNVSNTVAHRVSG